MKSGQEEIGLGRNWRPLDDIAVTHPYTSVIKVKRSQQLPPSSCQLNFVTPL